MKLYLLTQSVNAGYDTFDSVVVAAKSPKDARTIHPYNKPLESDGWSCHTWVAEKDKDKIDVEYLGKTKHKRGVYISIF